MTQEDLSKLKIDKSAGSYNAVSKKRPFVIITIIVAAIIIIVLLVRALKPSVAVDAAVVTQAYPSQTLTLLNASGYVVAQRKAAVASKITGRLEWLGVEEGSKVTTNQIIARLEGKDAAAAKDQAAANVKNYESLLIEAQVELQDAERNYKRMKDLVAKGYVSQMEFDSAEARYNKTKAAVESAVSMLNSAKAALKAAEVAVEYTLIRVPFDAVVLTKNADIGDIITPLGAAANAKAAVVTIADMTSLQVEVDVSESNLGKVTVGQPCEIQLDAVPDARFRGAVHMIVPTADRSKASVMIKVRFVDKDPRVLPEMSAKVAFLERTLKPQELVPRTAVIASALIDNNGKPSVFVIQSDSTVAEVAVKPGAKIGDLVEITEGLKPGDKIVANPPKSLKTGTKIAIREK